MTKFKVGDRVWAWNTAAEPLKQILTGVVESVSTVHGSPMYMVKFTLFPAAVPRVEAELSATPLKHE